VTKEYALICISRLKTWLNKRGYSVSFSHNNQDAICYESKTISLTTRTSFEKRVYSLLHECGHLIEWNDGGSKYYKKYPLAKEIWNDGRKEYLLEAKVQTIEEEISAWRKGYLLANSLGLEIELPKYNRYAARNIFSYIDWAANRKRAKNKEKKVVDIPPLV
jgi:hypothetical protein